MVDLSGLLEEGAAGDDRVHISPRVVGPGVGPGGVGFFFALTEKVVLSDLSGVVAVGLGGEDLLGPGLGGGLGEVLINSAGGEGHAVGKQYKFR